PEHPNAKGAGYIMEHRLIMSEMLGRQLRKGENVHHINGKRCDNRPENLELWNTTQPSGQREEDKIKWAKEILGMYGYEVTKKIEVIGNIYEHHELLEHNNEKNHLINNNNIGYVFYGLSRVISAVYGL